MYVDVSESFCKSYKGGSTIPTRGHSLKLFKPQILRDVRAHAFSQRIINDWNRLGANIVTAPSLSNFKQLYDKQYDAGL